MLNGWVKVKNSNGDAVWKWYADPTDVEENYAIMYLPRKNPYVSMYRGRYLVDRIETPTLPATKNEEEMKAWLVAVWRMTA